MSGFGFRGSWVVQIYPDLSTTSTESTADCCNAWKRIPTCSALGFCAKDAHI